MICQDELRSARTGRLTVCDLSYVWSTPALPLRIDLDVVSLWWIRTLGRALSLHHARARSGRRRAGSGGGREIAFEVLKVHEHLAHFVALEFKAAGVYRVEVLLDDEVVGHVSAFRAGQRIRPGES